MADTPAPAAPPRFEIRAVTGDVLDCDVCGLPLDRERTYVVHDCETDDTFHAGTTCGARLVGTTPSRFRTEADRQERDRAAAAASTARLAALAGRRHAMQAVWDAATEGMSANETAAFAAHPYQRVDRLAPKVAGRVLPHAEAAVGFPRPPYGGHAKDDASWCRYVIVEARRGLDDLVRAED